MAGMSSATARTRNDDVRVADALAAHGVPYPFVEKRKCKAHGSRLHNDTPPDTSIYVEN